jgi:hypothetical protein
MVAVNPVNPVGPVGPVNPVGPVGPVGANERNEHTLDWRPGEYNDMRPPRGRAREERGEEIWAEETSSAREQHSAGAGASGVSARTLGRLRV